MSHRWLTEDLWQSIAMAERDVRAAYTLNGLERPGPQEDDGGWDERPDWLAPFACPCGGVWHVRRHYDAHRCAARKDTAA